MTDLRSLDSAPDSQYDFGDLNKDENEKDKEDDGYDSKRNPLEMIQRDKERQKKGLPPMFSGPGASSLGVKNITPEQFSLKNKTNMSGFSNVSGPIKPNKLESKKDISETPEKMED